MSFSSFKLRPELLRAVADAGYTAPTPIQASAIPVVGEGHDLIGIAQTGTGKTAAFVLPLLEQLSHGRPAQPRTPHALIVAPTRELAAQIDESVRTLGRGLRLRCATVFGGVGEQPQIQALRRGADILVATPGRLLDLLAQRHLTLSGIRHLVLDEADRMLDMGFLPQIRKIVAAVPKDRQTLLFSATLSKEIEVLTAEFLRNPRTVEIGRRSNPADTVQQVLYPVPKNLKADLLLRLLDDQALDSVLVFSRTKHGADKIARKLTSAGIASATIHSNRSQNQRTAALEAFRKGRVRVLVATDIAARGIDVSGITHVINFDFPPQPEDYVHRIGRTGRAEAEGDAISFVTPEDEPSVRLVERLTKKPIERKRVAGFDYTDSAPITTYHRPTSSRPASSRPSSSRPSAPRRDGQRTEARHGAPHGAKPHGRPGAKTASRPTGTAASHSDSHARGAHPRAANATSRPAASQPAGRRSRNRV